MSTGGRHVHRGVVPTPTVDAPWKTGAPGEEMPGDSRRRLADGPPYRHMARRCRHHQVSVPQSMSGSPMRGDTTPSADPDLVEPGFRSSVIGRARPAAHGAT